MQSEIPTQCKNCGRKIVSHLDFRVETTLRDLKWRQKRIDTWNIRSFGRGGKFEKLKLKMERPNIDNLGVNEIKWPECEDFWSD